MAYKALIVSGEASSDLHGAGLLRELKFLRGDLEAFGIGGTNLVSEGLDCVSSASEISILGVPSLAQLKHVLGIYNGLLARVDQERPDFAVLMDLPEFNIRLAKQLKKRGIPVFYYVSPQIWAWRTYRVKQIKKYFDQMLVVFPFEKEFYRRHGVPAEFVGHPFLEHIERRTHFRSQNEVLRAPRVAVLPGSRVSEIRHHSPLMLGVLKKLREKYPNLEARLPVAPTLGEAKVREHFTDASVTLSFGQNAQDVLRWADVAVVASGTATLETALVGTPYCLFYWVPAFSALLFKWVVRWKGFLGMHNILLEKESAKELFQKKATVDNIVGALDELISNPAKRAAMIDDFQRLRLVLGDTGASSRAAQQIVGFMKEHRGSQPAGHFSLAPSPA